MQTFSLITMVIYLIFSFIMLYTIVCYFNTYFNTKPTNNINTILIYLCYLASKIFLFTFNDLIEFNFIITITSIYLISNTYRTFLKNKVIGTIFLLGLFIVVEMIVLHFASFFNKVPTTIVIDSDITFVSLNTISILIYLIFIKNYQYKVNRENKVNNSLNIFLFLVSSLIPIISITIIYLLQISILDSLIIITITFLLLLINIIFYNLYEYLIKTSNIEFDNIILNHKIKFFMLEQEKVKNKLNEIKEIKHDLKHHLTYVKSKLINYSDKEIDELIDNISSLMLTSIDDNLINYTNVFSIDYLLNLKSQLAKENDIPIDIKTRFNNQLINNEYILYIILSNLLDNALENFDNCKLPTSKINLKLLQEHNNIFIKIANPFNNKLISQGELFKTTKNNENEHGYGLKSVSKLVNENNGYFQITNKNNIFEVEVLLFNIINKSSDN